jgi:hypothetical protein
VLNFVIDKPNVQMLEGDPWSLTVGHIH